MDRNNLLKLLPTHYLVFLILTNWGKNIFSKKSKGLKIVKFEIGKV